MRKSKRERLIRVLDESADKASGRQELEALTNARRDFTVTRSRYVRVPFTQWFVRWSWTR